MQEEIEELEHILGEYDTFENESNRLLSDDIKIVYKKKKDLRAGIEALEKKKEEAEKKQEEVSQNLQILDEQLNELDNRLVQAKVSLRQMDGARMVEEERGRLALTKKRKGRMAGEMPGAGGFSDESQRNSSQFYGRRTNRREKGDYVIPVRKRLFIG